MAVRLSQLSLPWIPDDIHPRAAAGINEQVRQAMDECRPAKLG